MGLQTHENEAKGPKSRRRRRWAAVGLSAAALTVAAVPVLPVGAHGADTCNALVTVTISGCENEETGSGGGGGGGGNVVVPQQQQQQSAGGGGGGGGGGSSSSSSSSSSSGGSSSS